MIFRIWSSIVVGSTLLAASALAAEPDSSRFHLLLREAWEFKLREDPLFATGVGDHRYHDQLPSVAPFDIERRARAQQAHLERLRSIDRERLSPEDRVSYDIFARLTADELADYEFGSHLMPITNRGGFHVQFPELPESVPLDNLQDYDAYVSRLRGFRVYAHQHIVLLREGLKRGLVLPAVVLEGWEQAVEPHIVGDPTESLLWAPLDRMPDTISDIGRRRLRRDAGEAIVQSVVAGYVEFRNFMRDEYVPMARREIAASSLPEGRALYEHLVRHYTTLDVTPEELHERGLAEVARIRAEMEQLIARVEFEGSFEEFLEFLRTDERFYVDTPEELMKEVAIVLKRMDGALPSLFKTLPRMPYGIRQIPDYIAPKTTTAYYQRPAGDGTRAGYYFVNTHDLKSRPLYEIEALSLHEAVPGHHLQIALQHELEGLPEFRRFSGFTVFSEGWALYAERLGLEAGFYQDPYSDFGRLTYEAWRACRLVVDTGMHRLGWSRRRAIDYMAENTALTLHNITTEVDRYIAWPAQALAYKTGELEIRRLRSLAERRLGDRFDVRDFHDVVLGSGSVPLDVLRDNVEEYIERVAPVEDPAATPDSG